MVSNKEQSAAWRKKTKLTDPTYYTRAGYRWRLKYPKRAILNKVKNNANRAAIEFNLTEEDIIIPDICPVLGTKLEFKTREDDYGCSPSLDRFDSSKGYIKDNVHVISWRANRLKSDGTLEEFRNLVKWLEANAQLS